MFLRTGIDKREAQVGVRNDDGDVIEQVRIENANPGEIAKQYAGGEAVLEATTNHPDVYGMLSEYLDVVVGYPPKSSASRW